MLRAFGTFLLGALFLVIVIYVFKYALALIGIPPDLEHFIILIVGLAGVVGLIYLTIKVYTGGGPPLL